MARITFCIGLLFCGVSMTFGEQVHATDNVRAWLDYAESQILQVETVHTLGDRAELYSLLAGFAAVHHETQLHDRAMVETLRGMTQLPSPWGFGGFFKEGDTDEESELAYQRQRVLLNMACTYARTGQWQVANQLAGMGSYADDNVQNYCDLAFIYHVTPDADPQAKRQAIEMARMFTNLSEDKTWPAIALIDILLSIDEPEQAYRIAENYKDAVEQETDAALYFALYEAEQGNTEAVEQMHRKIVDHLNRLPEASDQMSNDEIEQAIEQAARQGDNQRVQELIAQRENTDTGSAGWSYANAVIMEMLFGDESVAREFLNKTEDAREYALSITISYSDLKDLPADELLQWQRKILDELWTSDASQVDQMKFFFIAYAHVAALADEADFTRGRIIRRIRQLNEPRDRAWAALGVIEALEWVAHEVRQK